MDHPTVGTVRVPGNLAKQVKFNDTDTSLCHFLSPRLLARRNNA